METSIYDVTFTAANDMKKRKKAVDGELQVSEREASLRVDGKVVKRFKSKTLANITTIAAGQELMLEGYEIFVNGVTNSSSSGLAGGTAMESTVNSNLNKAMRFPTTSSTLSKPFKKTIGGTSGSGTGNSLNSSYSSRYSSIGTVSTGTRKITTETARVGGLLGSNTKTMIPSSSSSMSRSPEGVFIAPHILRKLRPHQVVGTNFVLRALQGHLVKDDDRCNKENSNNGKGIYLESRDDGTEIRYYTEAKPGDSFPTRPSPKSSSSSGAKDDIFDSDFEEEYDKSKDSDAGYESSDASLDDDGDEQGGGVGGGEGGSDSSDEAFFASLLGKSTAHGTREGNNKSPISRPVDTSTEKIFRGCILCDEMGLGKTIQALAVIAAVTAPKLPPQDANRTARKAVVVCPATLIGNWAKEISKFFGPSFKPVILGGSAGASGGAAADKDALQRFIIGRVPLLVVSYETFRKCAVEVNKIKYLEAIVCDEGHRLKSSAGNKTIDALGSCRAKRRLVLTGTPVQNDLDELYALVSFVCPGYLGSLPSFRNRYANVIERGRSANASYDAKKAAETASRGLRATLANIMIRRTQDQVLRGVLPPKTDYVVYLSMSDEQERQYSAVTAAMFASLGEADPTAEASSRGEAVELNRGIGDSHAVLPCLQKLRAICTSPLSSLEVDVEQEQEQEPAAAPAEEEEEEEDKRDGEDATEQAEGDEEQVAPYKAKASRFKPPYSSAGPPVATAAPPSESSSSLSENTSAKMDFLVTFLETVQRIAPGEKVCIVSNFTSVLDIVEGLAKGKGWGCFTLTGATKVSDRQHMVDRFNSALDKHFLFLLSAKAGGAGLNLIGANRLISLDPDWNPATDQQAMARIWRQGQNKPVFLYRFVALNTIETAILDRQKDKGEIRDEVMLSVPKSAMPSSKKGFTKKDLVHLSRPHLSKAYSKSKNVVVSIPSFKEGDDVVLSNLTGHEALMIGVKKV